MIIVICFCSAAQAADLPDYDTESFILLTKNTNSNQVHYGVKVDKLCRPIEKDPVYAYWRVLEESPLAREKIAFWEQPGYGVKQPEQIVRAQESGSLEFVIRGVPKRKVRLNTFNTERGCRARALFDIGGQEAIFRRIDIYVSGWANVHKVEIHGWNAATGTAVSEITHQD